MEIPVCATCTNRRGRLRRSGFQKILFVQRTEHDRLGNVLVRDDVCTVQVGDRAPETQNTVITARRHAERVKGDLQQLPCAVGEDAVALGLSGGEIRVAAEAFAAVCIARMRKLPRTINARTNRRRGFARRGLLLQIGKVHRCDLDLDVDAVEQRSADAGDVFLHVALFTGAGAGGM